MNLSRRYFLGSFASAIAAPHILRAERPIAKVGILLDTHVSVDKTTVEPLLKAFRRFAAEGVGTVAISGDICEVGTLEELSLVMDAWHTAFPNGRNALGEAVDPVFVWGNHDYHDASYQRGKAVTEADRKNCILYNKDVAWKMVTGEDKMPGERICGDRPRKSAKRKKYSGNVRERFGKCSLPGCLLSCPRQVGTATVIFE